MTERKLCTECLLCEHDPFGKNDRCGYWGFPLHYEQRACSQFEGHSNYAALDRKMHAFPIGKPMDGISFPSEMLNVHDMSNKRHTLIFKTACVDGVWYIGQDYGRHYDDAYGAGWACSIYDGEYESEQQAINAKIEALIKSETYYRCDEAVQFLKTKRFENKQLTLF